MYSDELEDPQDDVGIEISSLDEGKPAGLALPVIRIFARRHKRPWTFATGVMVTLAVLLIVVSTSTVRGLAVKMLAIPTPVPIRALYPGEDLFFVQAAPIWGRLIVDGHAIASLPAIGVGVPLRLGRGQHELMWRAEPFQQQRCILSVPANYVIDTCIDHSTAEVQPGVTASIVEFQESLTALAPARRAALVQAVQDELNMRQSTVIVPKGELYALSTPNGVCHPNNEAGCYAVARQPLLATLNFQLALDASSRDTCLFPEPGCTFLHESCYTFCSLAGNTANIWDAIAPVLPLWTFSTLDGKILERGVPDNSLWDITNGELADESLVEMHIAWRDSAWQVDIPANINGSMSTLFNPVCAAAQSVVGMQNPPADAFGDPLYLQWQYTSGIVPASGCLGVGLSRQDTGSANSTSNSSSGLAYCMLRFGVLLAVNAEAHRFWPSLPLADALEQSVAQQLAQSINSNS